ncbi:MAG: hypothetical protein H5T33_04300 [Candidatus Methanosuratus sp.]|nr:hypothetical protein [Candidatus Methanosuratincola sp.]
MVKVSFRYNPELVQWIKSSGSGSAWNREEKAWEVPEEILDELGAKAKELGVEIKVQQGPAPTKPTVTSPEMQERRQEAKMGYIEYDSRFDAATSGSGAGMKRDQAPMQRSAPIKEGEIRLRRSKDGRFVLININLIAFTSDVEDLVKGTKMSVKFRVLPPPTFRQTDSE